MPGSLYVVSTPIGNLEDITLRALNTLKAVSLVAAEDTRRTTILLKHFGISTPTTSLHQHNEREKLALVLSRLKEGESVALVSAAGTPVVADPGQRLIAAAREQGIPIVPIPGPSAVMAALAASGFEAAEFVFLGYAPSKSNDRKRWLSALNQEQRVVVFFETPHRIERLLSDASTILAERPIVIGRELTKLHEQLISATTKSAPALNLPAKGEFTIVLGPKSTSRISTQVFKDKDVADYFYQLTKNDALGRRQALSKTASEFGLSTNLVYAIVERHKSSPPS